MFFLTNTFHRVQQEPNNIRNSQHPHPLWLPLIPHQQLIHTLIDKYINRLDKRYLFVNRTHHRIDRHTIIRTIQQQYLRYQTFQGQLLLIWHLQPCLSNCCSQGIILAIRLAIHPFFWYFYNVVYKESKIIIPFIPSRSIALMHTASINVLSQRYAPIGHRIRTTGFCLCIRMSCIWCCSSSPRWMSCLSGCTSSCPSQDPQIRFVLFCSQPS